VELVPVAMGLYGIGEVLIIAERITGIPDLVKVKLRELFPTAAEWKKAFPPCSGRRDRLLYRPDSRTGGDPFHFRRLFAGEEDFQTPGGIRKRGH